MYGESGRRIKVFVVDDHPLVRDGLGALIRQRSDMDFAGVVVDGRAALEEFRRLRPDVTLMDLGLPGMSGIATIGNILKDFSDARILVLSIRSGDEDVYQALQAGAAGYLLKDTPWPEIAEAILRVHRGERQLSPAAASALAARMGEEPLTDREREVLEAVATGLPNKEIASKLGISEATVKAHVTHLLEKLGATDRTQAVTTALRRGLVRLD